MGGSLTRSTTTLNSRTMLRPGAFMITKTKILSEQMQSYFITDLIAILPLLLTALIMKWIAGTLNTHIGPRTIFVQFLQTTVSISLLLAVVFLICKRELFTKHDLGAMDRIRSLGTLARAKSRDQPMLCYATRELNNVPRFRSMSIGPVTKNLRRQTSKTYNRLR